MIVSKSAPTLMADLTALVQLTLIFSATAEVVNVKNYVS